MSVIKPAIDYISALPDAELIALIDQLREDIAQMMPDEFGDNSTAETFKETLRKAENVAKERKLI